MTNSRRRAPLPLVLIGVAALLTLAGGLFAIVQPAQAQVPTSLVENNNLGFTSTGATLDADIPRYAQRFTTGPNAAGYNPSSFALGFLNIASTSTAGSELTVTLNENSGGSPGTALCTLNDPSTFGRSGVIGFPVSHCLTLAANTTYFWVIERANNNTNAIVLSTTSTHGEDPGVAPGWSIGDGAHHYVNANTPPWTHSSSSANLVFRLLGDVLEPVLASNTGETATGTQTLTSSHSSTVPRAVAQRFKTGTSTAGYKLASVGINFETIADTSTAGDDLEVTIRPRIATGPRTGHPGDAVCTLHDPRIFTSSGVQTFTAPTTCLNLTGDTGNGLLHHYYLYIERKSGTGVIRLHTHATIDPPPAGFAIANNLVRIGVTELAGQIQIEIRGNRVGGI